MHIDHFLKIKKPVTPKKSAVNLDQLGKLRIQVGEVIHITQMPKARNPSYQAEVNFGKSGKKTTCGQFVNNYTEEELLHTQIVAITNFASKKIAGVKSEALTLGFPETPPSQQAIILQPFEKVKNGTFLNFFGPDFHEEADFAGFLALEIRVGTIQRMEKLAHHSFAIMDMGTIGHCAALIPGHLSKPKQYVGMQIPVWINLMPLPLSNRYTYQSTALVAPSA